MKYSFNFIRFFGSFSTLFTVLSILLTVLSNLVITDTIALLFKLASTLVSTFLISFMFSGIVESEVSPVVTTLTFDGALVSLFSAYIGSSSSGTLF